MSSWFTPDESDTCSCRTNDHLLVRRFYSPKEEERQKLIQDYPTSYYNGESRTRPIDHANRATLTWMDVNVRVKAEEKKFFSFRNRNEFVEQKQLLFNVSGEVRPGTLLAIMGASGAGKTTLMNVLTCRNLKQLDVSGEVLVNGHIVGESITGISAYVQQNDLFIGTLTVKEHLVFQALLRMDKNLNYKNRMRRVDEVIQEMGLSKCENSLIGIAGVVKGISGGEAKRLALAAEVLTNPSLMFCDEPTSGLDSFMSQSIVSVLRQMAEGGRTIVCTIHQPSSEIYGLFDNLLLMAEGRVAYKGKADRAMEFFERASLRCPLNYNPADFFIQNLAIVPGKEAESRKKVKKICDLFSKEDIEFGSTTSTRNSFQEINPQFKPRYKASWCSQFRAVLWRSWISTTRDKFVNRVQFIFTALSSVVIGILFWQQKNDEYSIRNITGAMYSMLLTISSQSMLSVVNVLKAEEPLFLREHWNGMYRTDVYFLSKTITETPAIILTTVIYVTIAYFMIGLNSSIATFLLCFALFLLVADTGASFGYVMSCFTSSLNVAMTLAFPFTIPLVIAGGFYLNVDSLPDFLIWLKYISWYFYGYEALSINQWSQVTNITCFSSTCPPDGKDVLLSLGLYEENFYRDIGFVILLTICYRLLAFLGLCRKASQKT